MMNTMDIEGNRAIVRYDPEIEMFRGEFVGLNGEAQFCASDIESLKKEGAISLKAFIKSCEARGIEPRKEYSGKFNVRVPARLHAEIASAATAEGKSLNQWVVDALVDAVQL